MAALHSSAFLTISILLFICFLSSAEALGGKKTGGKTEIKNVKSNKEIQDLGKFSVDDYNLAYKKGDKGRLIFKQVVKAEKQVVSGIKYFLKVSLIWEGKPHLFDATVVVKAWETPSRSVVSFGPVD
ncbi:hypothetical protein C5167_023806 [Papaver somniferum]|uniref:Cystatin domain-containing protein n=1 Tax=Papaver somniferum TaxID=3469 RepID=A0A4Y7JLT0_PAPSO|nr:cysteine proteinase inhibitor B-like [Papaver somniferum]RZC62054.1 hypothetical protein C5167_023806 [Papaver somniferum]